MAWEIQNDVEDIKEIQLLNKQDEKKAVSSRLFLFLLNSEASGRLGCWTDDVAGRCNYGRDIGRDSSASSMFTSETCLLIHHSVYF